MINITVAVSQGKTAIDELLRNQSTKNVFFCEFAMTVTY
ncbi:hypothetical protein yruck0001_16630 [Yersinia ruckeri ATCC 29473]|nr:hypothetical protein yruck0001_16630 [Yersinia ruckeri ATCC 29473]